MHDTGIFRPSAGAHPLGKQLKLLVFLVLFAMLYLPLDLPVVFKVLISAVAVGVVETLNNKMRLFKVRVYLAAAG